jgi:hypothetical protein
MQLTKQQKQKINSAFATLNKLEAQLTELQQMEYANGSKVYDVTHWDLNCESIAEELLECKAS